MAILKKYKIINSPKNKEQKNFLNYLLYGKINKRKINYQIQYNKICSLIKSKIIKEIEYNSIDFNFYIRFDDTIIS